MTDINNKLAVIENTNELMFNHEAMNSMMKLAEVMAASKVTVPKHLQGSTGDCFAIIMQAALWKMNPFAVAQKTHIVNGTLGYEAQLVNAVIMASGVIIGTFKYEYKGEGNSLACRVGAVERGNSEITWGEWLYSSQVKVKNSPLWQTNEKQQIGYLQVKNWARAFYPGSILGVYTTDELEEMPSTNQFPREKTVNPTKEEEDFSFENLLKKIKSHPTDNFDFFSVKQMRDAGFTPEQVSSVRAACAARRQELINLSVVSTQTIQPQTAAPKNPAAAKETDWVDIAKNAESEQEIAAIAQSIPETAVKAVIDGITDSGKLQKFFLALPKEMQTKFNDDMDTAMDFLSSVAKGMEN